MASWISCPSRNILLAFAKGRMRRRRRHHHRQLLLLLYTSTTINPDMAAGIFYFLLFCFLLGRPLLLLPFFSSSSSISAALGSSNSVHTHICTHARFTLHGPSLFCSTHGEKRCVSLGRGGNEMKGRRKKKKKKKNQMVWERNETSPELRMRANIYTPCKNTSTRAAAAATCNNNKSTFLCNTVMSCRTRGFLIDPTGNCIYCAKSAEWGDATEERSVEE